MAAEVRIVLSEERSGAAISGVRHDLQDLGNTAEQAGGKTTGFFGGMMQVAGGFLAANIIGGISNQITGLVSGGISDARAADQLMASTKQTIASMGNAAGRSAEEIADMATALSDASGKSLFGDDQIQQSENLLLTFGEIKGATFDAATALTVDLAAALGGAPKDQAMMLGKALNDPIHGMTALGKAGLTFSDEQKSAIKTMQESGDMAGAQAMIIAELNKQVGGQAEAQAKAAGGMVQFNARMGEAAEGIGHALIPVLDMLGGFLTTTIAPAVESVAASFSAWLSDPSTQAGLTAIGEAISTTLASAMSFLSETAIPALVAAWGVLSPVVQTVVGLFTQTGDSATGMGAVIDTAVQFITGIINAYVQVVSAELAQISAFWAAHGAEITAFAQSAWSQISEIISLAMQLIQATVIPALQAIAGFIQAHGQDIQTILSGAWAVISGVIQAALSLITGVIKVALDLIHGNWSQAWTDIQSMSASFVSAIGGAISGFLTMIAGLFGTTLSGIVSTWESNWNNLVSLAQTAVGNIVSAIEALPGQVAGVGAAIVQAISDGFMAAWNSFVDGVKARLQEFRDTLPFSEPRDTSSPLHGLSAAGAGIVTQILSGIEDEWPTLMDRMGDMSEDLLKQMGDLGDKISAAIAGGFDATASIDRQQVKNSEAVAKLVSGMQDATKNALAQALEESKQFQDPAEAAKFFQMRSNQILEMAKLQDELNAADAAGDKEAKAAIQERMRLTEQAQAAEQAAMAERIAGTDSTTEALIAQIQTLIAAAQELDTTGTGPAHDALLQLQAMLAQLQSTGAAAGGGSPAPTLPTPTPMPGNGFRAGGPAPAGMPGSNIKITVDDRGMSWLQNLIKVEIDGALALRARASDTFARTGR